MEEVKNKKRVAWNKGLTKETDERVRKNAESTRKTVLEKYGTTSVFGSKEVMKDTYDYRKTEEWVDKVKATKKSKYGDENYNNIEKNYKTKESLYGDKNYNNQQKYIETCLSKYGETHPNKTEELKQKISKSRIENNSQEIAIKTIIEKYGDLETYYKMCSEKAYETRKENGTLCSHESEPEKELYKILCEKFGEEDIIKQYREERYPFKCDFYVKSEDLFIELNGHITHMYHPFDETNEDDLKTLDYLKSKNSDFYNAIIYTWADLDVRKLKIAKENNLNYWQIYWYKDKDIVYSQLKN